MKTIAALALLALCSCASTAVKKQYVCGCGSDCPKCETVSDSPGKCACGKPLVAR
jgi:hypothetical protein